MSNRRFGTLVSWNASPSGGFGFIDAPDGERFERFFLHRRYIASGNPTPGAAAVFEVVPPAAGTTRPRAVNVILNANVPSARETKIAPRIPANDVTTPGVEA